jgi:hypothetical protein
MKRTNSKLGAIVALVAVVLLGFATLGYLGSPVNSLAAQNRPTPGTRPKTVEVIDIDSSIAPLTGKRVMYVLEDSEGGLILEATGQGRKVPAIITYNYRGVRNADGVLVSPLVIFRPPFAGGFFEKDDVPSSSDRQQGTWDNFHPGDLRN